MERMSYYDIFSKLKFVTRFSGVNMIQPERLESHIIEMIGLAFDLHYGLGGFDIYKVIYLIVIHDIDESVTVDVPRPFKYHTPEFRKALDENILSYLDSLGINKEFVSDALNAKDNGLEGKILKLLDLVQVLRKLKTEESLGNSTLSQEIKNVTGFISEFKKSNPKLIKYAEFLTK